MNTLGKRIKSQRLEKSLTQSELAKLLGSKTYTTISKWESDDNFPQGKDIKKMCEIFNVTSDYLLGLDEKGGSSLPVSVPIIEAEKTGYPPFDKRAVIGYKEIIYTGLLNQDLFYLKITDDSMMVTAKKGAFVLCKKQDTVKNGEVATVFLKNTSEITLRRIRIIDGMKIIESESEDYDPFIATENNAVEILGKAIEVITEI